MASAPLISIALCSYNGARYLGEQLESLQAQTYSNWELVIVDDGSTDGTWELLQAHAARDARIRLHRNERNLGLIRNFERALQLCNGSLVAPCDQDDIWMPEKLSALAAALGDASLVYCDSLLVDAEGRSRNRKISEQRNMYEGKDPVALALANCIAGHAALIRREVVAAALPIPNVPYHDWWLAFVAANQHGIRYVPRPLVRYRRHDAAFVEVAARAAPEDRLRRYEQLLLWLSAIASFEGPEQRYLDHLYRAFRDVSDAWFSPRLAQLLYARRRQLFFIDRRTARKPWRTILAHASGIPLRKLLSRRYPDRRPVLP